MDTNILDNVSDSKINKALLNRPIRSIFDIAYTYGKLQILADQYELTTHKNSVSANYIKYMTPNDKSVKEYFSEPNTIISILVKWDKKTETFQYDGLEFESLSWLNAVEHGYCRPVNKAGRMIAHSICQLSSTSGYTFEKTSDKLLERFTRWASDDIVQSTIKVHEDGWIIQELGNFCSDKNINSLKSRIETQIKTKLSGQSKFKGLLSVKLDIGDGYKSPGEYDVLNEAMKKKKLTRLEEFQVGSGNSKGNGTCYVTEESGTVIGLPPGSPANFYTGQQNGNFPDLDPAESWRSKPLSIDAALAVLKASSMLDELSFAVTKGERIGYYPYYTDITPTHARDMYKQYIKVSNSEDMPSEVSNWVGQFDIANPVDTSKKRIYALLYNFEQNSVYNILNEQKSCQLDTLYNLHDIQQDLAKSVINNSSDKKDDNSYEWLFDEDLDLRSFLKNVFNGNLFRVVFSQDGDEGNIGKVFKFTLDVLGKNKIEYDVLIEEYVKNIIETQNWMFNESNINNAFPTSLVLKQYILLQLLAKSGLLTSQKPQVLLQNMEYSMDVMYEDRDEKLKDFLDSHKGLDSFEKRSMFLIGGLVGRLSQFQRNKPELELSTTLADQHPVDSISRNQIEDMVYRVLQKNIEYSEMFNIVMNSRYTDRLECLLEKDLTNWDISTNTARFYYSIGIHYGYSDYQIEDSEEEIQKDNK